MGAEAAKGTCFAGEREREREREGERVGERRQSKERGCCVLPILEAFGRQGTHAHQMKWRRSCLYLQAKDKQRGSQRGYYCTVVVYIDWKSGTADLVYATLRIQAGMYVRATPI